MAASVWFNSTGTGAQFIFAGWESGNFLIKLTAAGVIETALVTS